MAKIVIIGAGSGFGGRLGIDIMSREVLADSTLCLCDLHEGRLKKVTEYLQNTVEKYNLPTKIESGTDRCKFLPGADFVITSVSVGGGAYYGYPYNKEIEIPRRYGIDQSVGDSYSVGAVFRLLRTAPVHLAICRDIEKYCPDALLLNHTNPMMGLTMIHSLATGVKNVGLCHGIKHTVEALAKQLEMPAEEIQYKVSGINHLAWFLELKKAKTGEGLYSALWETIHHPKNEQQQEFLKAESVRIEIMRNFSYFPTESNGHDSEYMPYFRGNDTIIEKYYLKKREIRDSAPNNREWSKDAVEGEKQITGELKLSGEYTTGIMQGVLTNVPFAFNGNIMNHGLIPNLPKEICVEVPCFADANGINPSYMGSLPVHLAGLNYHCAVPIQLAVESILEKNKEKAFYAAALDPYAAANLTMDKIKEMFDEMWEAEGDLLEWYRTDKITERYALD